MEFLESFDQFAQSIAQFKDPILKTHQGLRVPIDFQKCNGVGEHGTTENPVHAEQSVNSANEADGVSGRAAPKKKQEQRLKCGRRARQTLEGQADASPKLDVLRRTR
jgi:hypothetical protein